MIHGEEGLPPHHVIRTYLRHLREVSRVEPVRYNLAARFGNAIDRVAVGVGLERGVV